MRLTVFQSDKGDCLLLTGADDTRILIDGGMAGSYSEHVAKHLEKFAKRDEPLDLVYVSHIDQDHISGVLQLMDDLLEWRVYYYQRDSGNRSYRAPTCPRPPDVRRLWQNVFHDQVRDNAGEIESLLAASSAILDAAADEDRREEARSQRDLITAVAEGIKLSKRAGWEQLGIPVNQEFGGRLIQVRNGQRAVRLGSMALTVVGPFAKQLNDLRTEWNNWLKENRDRVARIRERMGDDAKRLESGEVGRFRELLELRAQELGDIKEVTAPNLASLMLLVTERGKTVLLTGDGHKDHIIEGLRRAKKLNGGGIHVDVLKVQHHGSEHNIDAQFCKQVTADHYVFCGNGAHENPDLRAVDAVVRSRLGADDLLSPNAEADGKFKLWFNSSPSATENSKNKAHMREVERMVRSEARRSKGRMKSAFLNRDSFDIEV